MSEIKSCLVQDGEHHDYILHNISHPVNIRLLKNNPSYLSLITSVISHMLDILETDFDNYAELQGLSGANVGIPFNIVILTTDNEPLVMINPEIIKKSKDTKTVTSNCGSINLAEPIKVKRWKKVRVKYVPFNVSKTNLFNVIKKSFNTGTVQHEIDHNLGILIIDKELGESICN
jgi:peptide deformylase